MKSTPQQSILLTCLATLCVITVIVVSLYSPCLAEQPSLAGDRSVDEAATPAEPEVNDNNDDEQKVGVSTLALIPHRQNYFLLINYENHPNNEAYETAGEAEPKNYEAKFQLSFKKRLLKELFKGKGDLFFAYTQRSFWQLYDEALSSPFRETNYEPEVYVEFDKDFNVPGLNRFLIGLNHQSNGRGGLLSRSWNRIIAEFVTEMDNIIAEKDTLVIRLKPWFRILEHEDDDDNPDIQKYMGDGELIAAYRVNKHVISLMLRNNLRTDQNKGAVALGWSYQFTENVSTYMLYFNGYGESLVDYNDSASRIGFGVMLNDWL